MGNSSINGKNGKIYDVEDSYGVLYSHSPTNLFVELGDNSLPAYLCAHIKKIYYTRDGYHVKGPPVDANWEWYNELNYDDQLDYDVGYKNGADFKNDTILGKSKILDDAEIRKKCEEKILLACPGFKNVAI